MKEENVIQFPELKIVEDDFEVIFSTELGTVSSGNSTVYEDERKRNIIDGLHDVSEGITYNQQKIDELNKEIDRLTNHSDGIDYMVAVGSGVLAGMIDSFWVGEFNFDRGKEKAHENVNKRCKRTVFDC